MATYTGGYERTEGPQCRQCKATEAACARTYPCCADCRHWRGWSADGEPADGRRDLTPVDEVTAKRREQWRRQYATRRVS